MSDEIRSEIVHKLMAKGSLAMVQGGLALIEMGSIQKQLKSMNFIDPRYEELKEKLVIVTNKLAKLLE